MQWLYAGQPSCLVWFIAELADDHLAHDWEKVLRYCQQFVFCACGLLLQVTKGLAILALVAQYAQLRERSSADSALGPRYFWEGCVVFGVVCRDIAFPTYLVSWWGQDSWHLLLHFTLSFLSYIQSSHHMRSAILFTDTSLGLPLCNSEMDW